MNITTALKRVRTWYNEALKCGRIENKVAWALYKTLLEVEAADKREQEREARNE